jgi:hypothetical protein
MILLRRAVPGACGGSDGLCHRAAARRQLALPSHRGEPALGWHHAPGSDAAAADARPSGARDWAVHLGQGGAQILLCGDECCRGCAAPSDQALRLAEQPGLVGLVVIIALTWLPDSRARKRDRLH